MVEGPEHVAAIAAWLKGHGVRDAFVIGGDAPEPFGPYLEAGTFMQALIESDSGLARIGFGGYPDGHAAIPTPALDAALLAKQQLLDQAGLGGWVSTQMCFDTSIITAWILKQRASGLHLPINLGIPGVIDTAKLLTTGMRLGVGASLRYLKKNRAVVSKLATPGGYDPMDALVPLTNQFEQLDISALHVFTFNQVANTVAWQRAVGGGATFLDNPASDAVVSADAQGARQHGLSL
jgi:methylenetetrahydrofolate reductase (NADPH)